MKYSQWIGFAAALLVAFACYLPWIEIGSLSRVLTGMEPNGTNFGKPGKLHLIFCAIASVLFLLPFIWAKRVNWFFCALGVAWAVRNFLIYARCEMGNCPERRYGLYLVLCGSLLMLLAAFFPDIKIEPKKESQA